MTYTAIWKDEDGVLIEDDLQRYNIFNIEDAVKEAKKIAKKNGWTVVSVKPKVFPQPSIVNLPNNYPDEGRPIRYCPYTLMG